MAEFAIKVDDGGGGGLAQNDLVHAFNNRKIRWRHAADLCHPWRNGVNEYGLRVSDSIVEDWFDATCSTLYERISTTELRRTNRWTSEVVVLSNVPQPHPTIPGRTIRTNVPLFVERRLAARAPDGGPQLTIFGSPGAEYWYGGTKDLSNTKMNTVWAAIEAKTAHREVDYTQWPFTGEELRRSLVVSVNDFANEHELEAPLLDTSGEIPVQVAARQYFVNWQGDLALAPAARALIQDPDAEVDIRLLSTFNPASILQLKTI